MQAQRTDTYMRCEEPCRQRKIRCTPAPNDRDCLSCIRLKKKCVFAPTKNRVGSVESMKGVIQTESSLESVGARSAQRVDDPSLTVASGVYAFRNNDGTHRLLGEIYFVTADEDEGFGKRDTSEDEGAFGSHSASIGLADRYGGAPTSSWETPVVCSKLRSIDNSRPYTPMQSAIPGRAATNVGMSDHSLYLNCNCAECMGPHGQRQDTSGRPPYNTMDTYPSVYGQPAVGGAGPCVVRPGMQASPTESAIPQAEGWLPETFPYQQYTCSAPMGGMDGYYIINN
ncbi:hypothetical protein DCS_06354 [Drechmeria coniospora]|uniref:Zn(2)-C6 fungal-type domain-containing protein n=1 Tax=Drechmeria coniospora TaxID=98403 RepID=A0A151GB98_DRECN|nr:hypothetical protein DCS_06354 [Drechmeria coniospora]KYK54396.1 hypothetical protein DCS_06354 [Drechmeria coniospora]